MSKDETPSSGGGLLSKVVRFVRNPTVNWSELDSIQDDKESQYSKQMLKEMIERKRRNDFVRRREFDQLRKLRQRDALSGQRTADPTARPSFFQSSLTSPGERAVTIKKIDEIEAQMSMQWWKSKQAGEGPEGMPPSGEAPSNTPTPAQARAYAPTAPLELQPAPTARTAPEPLFAGDSLPALDTPEPQEPPDVATWDMGNPAPVAAPALEKFVHEPDLEEAAIRFANGDYAGAEAGLLEVLERHSADEADAQFDIWMTLFDLYRATGQQDRFDALAIDFAGRFARSAPLWFSIPEQLGLQAAVQAEPAAPQREFAWNAPAAMTLQSVAALQASINRSASPWTLTWTRLKSIDDNALTALANEFGRWADTKGQFVFTGAQALLALLQERTQSGDREANPEWWRLRMAVLRFMGQADEFEMVALDYCVTYEVSPPSWANPLCGYSDDATPEAAPAAPPAQDLVARPHWKDSTTPAPLTGFGDSVPALAGLTGHIEGDATHLLDGMQDHVPAGQPLAIPCDKLIRIDFTAAGSVLNWAAQQQALGREVQFHNLHRLVAVLFNVLGVNEHAWVLPRKN
ncbi:MAG: STAS domain-containing protein [Giesbergeria sp.]